MLKGNERTNKKKKNGREREGKKGTHRKKKKKNHVVENKCETARGPIPPGGIFFENSSPLAVTRQRNLAADF